MTAYDLVIENGHIFDGSGQRCTARHLGIRDGCVVAVSEEPLDAKGARVIDAEGHWVMPGFVDTHTHYEAELVAAPGLGESVRHGVTTVITGSCSLSMVYSNPLDCADLYSRVEALPYEPVHDLLTEKKTWSDPEGWIQYLNGHALGPNVASMLGHSDLRASVMGLGRSTSGERPTKEETQTMVDRTEDAMQAGFVGLSTMTNPWDKLAGDRYRSRSLPSTYATWREYGGLHRVLRKAGRVLQSAPNLNTKLNIFRFFWASGAWFGRKALKTSLISAADPKSSPWLAPLFKGCTRLLNWLLRGKLRWQAIPSPFEIYADGIDLVVFEEFGSGAAAMHLADEVARNELLQDEAYRRRFRKDYEKKFSPRIWHRDFHDAQILACPEEEWVGMNVGEVADARGIHPCDAFLDLVVKHGSAFRWKTLIANHRPEVLDSLIRSPHVQIGFADSGAHLRNMAFYNFPLCFLKRVRDAEERGEPLMTLDRAVHRVTAELADWFDLDAGRIEVGSRADIAIIRPQALDEELYAYHEAEMAEMGHVSRMVRRNDRAVLATLVGGEVVFESGNLNPELGDRAFGRFLRAGETNRKPLAARTQDGLRRSA